MNANSLRESIRDALAHRPFDCEVIHLYELAQDQLTTAEVAAQKLLDDHRQSILSALSNRSGKSPTWRSHAAGQEVAGSSEILCYGACRVGPMVVVVGKPVPAQIGGQILTEPIDSYFMDAVQVRVAEILGIDLTRLGPGARQAEPRPADPLSADLRLLDVFEADWRHTYGDEAWLAVKGGTVVAHALTRKAVEEQVRNQAIEPPVLYVPPKKEKRICEMFSIGL